GGGRKCDSSGAPGIRSPAHFTLLEPAFKRSSPMPQRATRALDDELVLADERQSFARVRTVMAPRLLLHRARLRVPDLRRVLCDGPVARESPGADHVESLRFHVKLRRCAAATRPDLGSPAGEAAPKGELNLPELRQRQGSVKLRHPHRSTSNLG